MNPRIRSVLVRPVRLTPTEAELAIDLHCTELHSTTELRGRLMGPSCLYSTTIEVAYPIRMISRTAGAQPVLHGKVVIPEPAWWDPESPFLYHGPVELWEHESRVESAGIRIGVRHAKWDGERLIWNGQPLTIRSQTVTELDEETLRLMRDGGINAVIVPKAVAKSVWPLADRIGLVVFSDATIDANSLAHPCAMPPPIA